MAYAKIKVSKKLRAKVRLYLDPVQAAKLGLFTPRFDSELPTICHAIALEVGQPTDWAFAAWSLLRTWASRGTRRRTTTPNCLTYLTAAKVLTAAGRWQPRTVHQRLQDLVDLGFARCEIMHGERCLFWVSSSAILTHLRQRFPLAESIYSKLHWLARRGDRYLGSSQRRTFLPEIISFTSLARLRAALSQALRLDAAPVNMGRIKQAELLGCSETTNHRRVLTTRRQTHERIAPHYHQVYQAPRDFTPAQQHEVLQRIIQASRKAFVAGEVSSPLLVKQTGDQIVLVRQLPSRSTNRRFYAFTGTDLKDRMTPRHRIQDLRPVIQPETTQLTRESNRTTTTERRATSTSRPERLLVDQLATATESSGSSRLAGGLDQSTNQSAKGAAVVVGTTVAEQSVTSNRVDRVIEPYLYAPDLRPVVDFPIANLHRHLCQSSLTVKRIYITNRTDTQQVGITVHLNCHYERNAYTERLIDAVYDWDPELTNYSVGQDPLGPPPPRSAYKTRRSGRPTLGYFRRFTKLRRPTRSALVTGLGPDCFSRVKQQASSKWTTPPINHKTRVKRSSSSSTTTTTTKRAATAAKKTTTTTTAKTTTNTPASRGGRC